MRKTIIGALLVLLALAPVWGAGQQEAATEEGPVSLNWLVGVWANQVDPNGYFAEAAKEALNVDITIDAMPAAQLTQKTQVLIAGGDYPEMLMMGPSVSYKQWATQGLFVQLDEYWNDYPGLVSGYPEDLCLVPVRVNGGLYMVPVTLAPSRFNFMVREDWLANVGMDFPTTIEEFYEVAKAFREDDPDNDGQKNTYAFGMDKFGGTTVGIINPGFGIPGNFQGYHIDANGEVQANFLHANAKDALAFLKRCYEEGLLDPDSVTKIYAEQEKDFLAGRTGISLGNNSKAPFIEDQLKASIPSGEIAFGDPLVSDDGKQVWQFYSPVWRGNVITQKADTEAKIRGALSLLDWMIGDGHETTLFGPEGVYWTERGSHGKPLLVGDGLARWSRSGEGYHELRLCASDNDIESYINPDLWADENKVAVQLEAFQRYEPFAVYDPTIGITTPTMVDVGATLSELILAGVFEIIVGGEPVSYLDTVIEEWDARGGSKMLGEIDAEYRRMYQ